MTNPAETDLTGAQGTEQALSARDEPLMQNNTSMEAVARVNEALATFTSVAPLTGQLAQRAFSTLLAEHEAMRKALEEIAEHPGPNGDEGAWFRVEIARQALGAPDHG